MKSEIIDRACGGKWGTLGFRSKFCGPRGTFDGVASKCSSPSSHANATLPIPIALRERKRRRVRGAGGNRFIRCSRFELTMHETRKNEIPKCCIASAQFAMV